MPPDGGNGEHGGGGGRWIRYRGSSLRFVSRFRGNDRGIIVVMLFHGFRSPAAHYTRGYAYSTATRSEDRPLPSQG